MGRYILGKSQWDVLLGSHWDAIFGDTSLTDTLLAAAAEQYWEPHWDLLS